MERALAQVVRGRAVGVRVGTLIGCGWAAWGLAPATIAVRIAIGLPAVVVAVALLFLTRGMLDAARDLPAPISEERSANRRVWTYFWINVVVEIVLLNVAINLLRDPAQRIYWIPAISLVVGLHFVPMAIFFRVPSYFACAAAMIVVSAGVSLVLASGAPATLPVSIEALLNAVILWSTAGWGLRPVTGHSHRRGSDVA